MENIIPYSIFESKSEYTLSVSKSKSDRKIEIYNVKLKLNNKLLSKCFFIKPYIQNNIITLDDGGSLETFPNSDDRFIKVYDVKSLIKGKGYGEVLFNELKKYLKDQNINRIYLDVDIENTRAQKFYTRIGFKKKWKGYDDYRYVLKF